MDRDTPSGEQPVLRAFGAKPGLTVPAVQHLKLTAMTADRRVAEAVAMVSMEPRKVRE